MPRTRFDLLLLDSFVEDSLLVHTFHLVQELSAVNAPLLSIWLPAFEVV